MPKVNRIIWFVVALVLLASCEEEPPLPYLGPSIDGEEPWQVPKFWFENQDGEMISHESVDGKVYVADFFFSNCPSICPIMTSQMARLQDKLKNEELWGEVVLLSHSVDGSRDSTEVLRAYADRISADTEYWQFLTGDQHRIHEHAEKGYFLTAFESDTAAGGFFHTDQFALVDKSRHIRGYYDGTSTTQVDMLFEDIKHLLKEYDTGKTE